MCFFGVTEAYGCLAGSLGYAPGPQDTGPSMSILPGVGIAVVQDAARDLQNWLAGGTDGLILGPWVAGWVTGSRFSETTLKDVPKWSWLSGFAWNTGSPHALPASLQSSSPDPRSVLSIILPGLHAVGAWRLLFCLQSRPSSLRP